ncbi:MAG: FAD-dependent hydroxylase [Jaaginema sp. PMC 1079.18]|nr:FAD-dependent hydroxylase [Jaaginema sp. PMC 1080.18]MEC4854044.1 FAD-dependent hydroxylase [Jaaginema sp. PMC 1079.18]MEC4867031.1 FAD-dependent hydroxylase [Jaaginema sp. PMC 1078.18]
MTQEQLKNTLDCDLAIVGGGIVGTTLAAALKHSGMRILLIEAQTLESAIARPQAYAISLLSGRIFQGIGVWEQILPRINPFKQINLSDADYPQTVKFETQDLKTEELGYVGEHGVILQELHNFLATCANVEWLCPAQVTAVDYQTERVEIAVKINGETRKVRSRLVVGADGARSRIRQWAKIKTQGWKYWQSCIATQIQHEAPRNDIAFERFCDSGPMGVLPLPGNRVSIVWTAPHAEAQALQNLSEAEFIAKLDQRLHGTLGKLELVRDRACFPVQLMQSDRYVKPRLALVGDAAHCCHPVGGQGLNLGIRDAAALAQTLTTARQQAEDIGSLKVLQRYQRWRKPENWLILGFTDFLDRTFSNNFLPIVAIRRLGLWILQNVPLCKIYALKLMTGLLGRAPVLGR